MVLGTGISVSCEIGRAQSWFILRHKAIGLHLLGAVWRLAGRILMDKRRGVVSEDCSSTRSTPYTSKYPLGSFAYSSRRCQAHFDGLIKLLTLQWITPRYVGSNN